MEAISEYYSAIQLRTDRWNVLKEVTQRLCQDQSEASRAKLKQKSEALFTSLSSLENYWAFPGREAFDHLRKQLDHGHYEELAFTVKKGSKVLNIWCLSPSQDRLGV